MSQQHDDNADIWVGGFRDKVAALMGIKHSHVPWAVTSIVALVVISVVLAVGSGNHLYRQYQAGQVLSSENSEQNAAIERLSLPTTLQAGEPLIGTEQPNAVCGMHLRGEAGIAQGWIWDDSAQLCRRYRHEE